MTLDGTNFSVRFSRALGKVIVHIHGALDGDTAHQLKDRLVDAIDGQGNLQLVLDLRRVTLIDSAGFAGLVDALKRMQKGAASWFSAGRWPTWHTPSRLLGSTRSSPSLQRGRTLPTAMPAPTSVVLPVGGRAADQGWTRCSHARLDPQLASRALGQDQRSWSAKAARPGLSVSRAWRRARTKTR